MNNEEFDKTIDVYSFGIILWQIYTLQEPFANYDDLDEFKHAICVVGIRPAIPPYDPTFKQCQRPTPTSLRSLMQSCWHADRRRRPSFTDIVVLLNEVLVDLFIDDVNGATFWKQNFHSPQQDLEEVVRWRDFNTALSHTTGITDKSRFEILNPFLANYGSDRRVTIADFNQAIYWLGDFFVQEKAEETLHEITSLITKPWFHGFIDQHEADGRLSKQISGTFLVRLSKTYPWYPFTLSLPAKKHLRIKKIDGEFSIDIKNYTTKHKTIIDLIEGIRNSFNPPLTAPCPQTPAPPAYENENKIISE